MLEKGVAPQGIVPPKPLQPTCATTNAALASTNLLYELDSAAQQVVTAVTDAQVGSYF